MNCTQLVNLYLEENSLEGTLPKSIGNLSKSLQLMMIGRNQIVGSIPLEIGNLTNLNTLFMDQNLLVGNIPPVIGNLKNLVILSLSTNKLSGPIPSSLGNLNQLNEIYLDINNLTGNIPTSLGKCINLNYINLSLNYLDGPIPKELFSISTLSQALDLSHNSLSGAIPPEVGNLNNAAILNISENYISDEIPSSIGNCIHLEYLRMEGNHLKGGIPTSFTNLKGLKEMDLSLNNLSGRIPEFFESFSSLYYLNLSFNNLDGPIPTGGVFNNESEVFIQGNNRLCTKSNTPLLLTSEISPCLAVIPRKKSISHSTKIILAITGVVFLTIFFSSLFVLWKWIRLVQPPAHKENEKYKRLSYLDLYRGTDGFSTRNLVGTGRFGSVYRGKLDYEDNLVAIKVFDLDLHGGMKSFTTECKALRNLRHKNIVRVVTSCSTINPSGNAFRALVFEYMLNGSLEEWLHPKSDGKALSLSQRIKICADVAPALEYLHDQCISPVVHCDVKPSNVLLDHAMIAHVSDFGIAEFLSRVGSKSYKSTSSLALRGSIGYIPPEYGAGGRPSTEGDVYSFGILLLEMLTGKRPTDEIFKDGLTLSKLVYEAFPDKINEIIDPTMCISEEADYPSDRISRSVLQLAKLGLSCTEELPNHRMKMRQVSEEVISIRQEL